MGEGKYFHNQRNEEFTDLVECWYDLILKWYAKNQSEVRRYHKNDSPPYTFGLTFEEFKSLTRCH